jgi:two-component system OmpR family sensor kinase
MSLAILGLIATMNYRAAKAQMLSEHRLSMQLEGERYLPRLVHWMQGELRTFPADPAYETAFYVGDRLVGGRLSIAPALLTPGVYAQGRFIYLVIPMGSYGLKEGKAVMMTVDDGQWLRHFERDVMLYGTGLFLLLFLIGVGLSRLFLRPMKAAVTLLDDFIKDTTHELNTPVTAILTNIERLDLKKLDEKQAKKIRRIETAAQTIGMLYDDLTYLLLKEETQRRDASMALAPFLRERLEYFHTRFNAKRLEVSFEVHEDFEVMMDRALAARLIDNLLSNAVKYSDVGSTVHIVLDAQTRQLEIRNSGAPIPAEKLKGVFERYVRAEKGKGGFGIGLHLVARIAKQYGIRIDVSSKERLTVFRLTWPRYTPQPL